MWVNAYKPLYSDIIIDNFLTFNDIESCEGSPLTIESSLYSIKPSEPIVSADSKLALLLGFGPRKESDELTQLYFDLAASAQAVLNKIVLHIANYAIYLTGNNNLCLAGGVALNCTLNSYNRNNLELANMFVQLLQVMLVPLGAALVFTILNTHTLHHLLQNR